VAAMRGQYPNMCRLLTLAVRALALSCLFVASAMAGPAITGVRVGEHSAATRFVLDVTHPIEYRVFTLAKPYRVVVDMPEVDWQLQSDVALDGTRLISAFRFGRFTPQTTRVVLDAAGPVTVDRTFFLAPNGEVSHHRLVLDLRPVSAAEFERISRERQVAGGSPLAPAPGVPDRPPRSPGDKRVIVIDPGHGGVDPGTIGVRGTQEKHVTLALAREIAKTLEATGRYEVVLTRDRDYFIPLRGRVAKARQEGGELFVSLHADSIRNRRTRGASVYTLSETASDKEAAALAAKENRSDVIAGVDLANETDEVANILIDLAQRETMNLSARFANLLIGELGNRVKLLRNTHRFAGFAVLKAPDVPSVLIEVGYLSNRLDEMLLRKSNHQRKVASAVAKAIDRFFAETDKLTKS